MMRPAKIDPLIREGMGRSTELVTGAVWRGAFTFSLSHRHTNVTVYTDTNTDSYKHKHAPHIIYQ